MSIVALKISMNPASKELTYGWHRAEIIGTMISVIFLLAITFWLLVEASSRVINPQKIDAFSMIITAVAGLFFNFI
jgi:Co/Zn/Cd efflux system component